MMYIKTPIKLYGLVICIVFLVSGCKSESVRKTFIQEAGRENKIWEVVWEDHFNSPILDTTKWTKIPQGRSDWNDQMTDKDDRCFGWNDGKLHLIGIKNADTIEYKRPYLTGGIYSKGKFAFRYGRVEIRAKLESAQGAWPAIWMLASEKKYGNYPRNGEIDIMEHLNFDDIFYQTVHSYYTLELKEKENPLYHGTAPVDAEVFNTYGLEWYPDKLVFTLNGAPTFTYPKLEGVDASQWPFDQPFYLLIDQQLGGSWVGDVDIEQLPVNMIIDWVKVYQ